MLKKSLSFAVTFFLANTIWQIIRSQPISWFENTMVSLLAFLIYLFFEWTGIPFDWNKKSKRIEQKE
ncbi:hypothetical protein H9655_10900 [Cytobacillus sp. Sa5YUA1]|uniref:Holin n=1 Tax=Cytobacillus stercorigallinarum TaxID=2762240 RepID=A0ABR8QPR3_9BACI|nr:hypothetical protein [Cytobacillus stercorigallinarum]MBD7937532.1 hypothetical protein [Cytobacillus stercorigallinarum]